MHIGIAFDLKADVAAVHGSTGPDDSLEEYDSPETVDAIERALIGLGHHVSRLGGGRRFLAAVLASPPDLVFNFSEGYGSRAREAHVPAVCEMLGIPCTLSDPLTMAVALDKGMAKRIVAAAGVATPRFTVIETATDLDRVSLAYPLFAKPLFEGSSMGIRRHSRLASQADLHEHVGRLLADYGQPVLVEEYCSGPEFTVAIIGTGVGARVAGVMALVPTRVAAADFIYSLEVKRNVNWKDELQYVVPPDLPAGEVEAIGALARGAYQALGCRDIARIDVRMDGERIPRFIEANPLPGLVPGWSDLVIMWDRLGRSYDDLVATIVAEACQRLSLGETAGKQ